MALTDAAYQAEPGGPLDADKALYDRIRTAPRELVDSLVIPIRSGRAWRVPKGHVCRVYTIEGPQVLDFNVWNAENPRERLWASKTRQLQAAHVTTYDRLWSNLPYLRPLLTVIDDTLAGYGPDEDGGRVHDLLGTRCDPYTNRLLTGEDFDYHCHSNLTRAAASVGLEESDVHDVLNIFQVTGLNDRDQYYMKACPAQPGDHFEFFAELDLLCAGSTCPGGDLSIPMWGPDARDPLEVCRPVGIEVYKVADEALEGWLAPERNPYAGQHGRRSPDWSEIN